MALTESIWKASLVWLVLIIAFFISRKRADMIPLMVTVAALAFLSGANSAMLLGMLVGWLLVGVGFGATIGMAVGNIVGYGRSAGIEKAPNASQESRRPLFERGIVLPLGVAIASGILYALALPPLIQFLESR
jgi:amino acid transporter